MAISSNGTILKAGDGATPTEVFTAIAEVKDVTGPSMSLETEDVSHQGSTAAEFVGTLVDHGEVGFDLNFDPAGTTHLSLRTDLINKTLRNFQLVFPDTPATQFDFAAYVTKFEVEAKVKGALTAKVTLKISGEVTLVP